jgi:hypothetical protein
LVSFCVFLSSSFPFLVLFHIYIYNCHLDICFYTIVHIYLRATTMAFPSFCQRRGPQDKYKTSRSSLQSRTTAAVSTSTTSTVRSAFPSIVSSSPRCRYKIVSISLSMLNRPLRRYLLGSKARQGAGNRQPLRVRAEGARQRGGPPPFL